jgi:dolichyl-phosphate-mannose-protein mannosyltransferase
MQLAERLTPLWLRLRTVRLPSWLGPFGREPWVVLGPLLAVQWLALLALLLTVRHNSWLFYQGGDQTYYYTDARLFSHWRLPTAEVGWGWSYVLTPIAGTAGDNVLSGLPAIVLLDTLVLLPVALLAVYGIGTRIAGRLFGYWAAAVWIAVPFVAIPLFVQRYHGKYVEQTLPQTFGMSALADFPSMVLLLVGAYLIVRALDTRDWREPVLAGLVLGFAFCVKPSNAIFFFPAGFALLLARRWRQLVFAGAALVPALLLTALWKQRGLGQLPLFTGGAGGDPMLAALGMPVPHAPLASLSRYVNIDWDHLRLNRDQLREFFWSVRPLEWLPIAGLLALGRRSWPKAGLVTAWLVAFLVVKGTAENSSVEDASFFRLMMPSFPAFVLLLAAIPLLVPKLGDTIAGRFPPGPANPRRLEWTIAVVAVIFVLIPLVVLAATRVQVGQRTVKNEAQHTSIPVSNGLRLSARPSGGRTTLSWSSSYHGPVGVYYAVLRSRPRFPDPSNPDERTVVDGVSCKPRQNGAAQDCSLFMRQIHATKDFSFVDRSPPGGWTYRVALGANWLDDPERGDFLMVSQPVTVRVRGHP